MEESPWPALMCAALSQAMAVTDEMWISGLSKNFL
jgi:hypothetical protein